VFSRWWSRRGKWKWWATGFAVLVVVSGVAQTEDEGVTKASPERGQATKAAVTAPPVEITAASLDKDGHFWNKPENKTQLAALCVTTTARQEAEYDASSARAMRRLDPKLVIERVDKTYAADDGGWYDSRDDSVRDTCDYEVPEIVFDQEIAREEAKLRRQLQRQAEARRKLENFQATNELARVLMNDRLGDENVDGKKRVRSVNCVNRTTCTISYMEDPTGSLVEELFESNDEPEDIAQAETAFFDSMAKLFKSLFKDPKLQSATLVPHGGVISIGGKESVAPIMWMSCTRAAHRQINWDNIAYDRPDGFKQLCSYQLLVSLG
jgi:hypothetical protein